MSSAVYFKFKASLKQYTIPFEGSAISVKDLRNAIRLSCGLKSTDFELQIIDKQGKDYPKEDDLIPKFSDLIVRRLPKVSDPPKRKIANPEDMTRRDPYKAMNALPKINPYSNAMNLAKANIPDDEKLDIMTKRCSEEYSEKNYAVKPKPYGVPPASYVCNKCHQGGHWIHECPGLRDRDGRLLDFKSVKRPTGIPQDFLLEVSPGTPGAYLTKEGKYMVPIKDAEAYAMGKKEKRPFSIEENPPYVNKDQELPLKLQCPLCSQLLDNPTSTPCCSSVFCVKCISDYLYDPEVNGSRQCPSCFSVIEHHESLVENELLRQLIQCWKANMLTKDIVDSCLTVCLGDQQQQHSSSNSISNSSNKKTELNEDSSKSTEMKFNSANDDTDTNNIETELEKVFVNNRRVLKPKIAIQKGKSGSPSGSQDNNDNNNPTSNLFDKGDEVVNGGSIKSENVKGESSSSVIKITCSEKEQDVNDLIFNKVQDFEPQEVKNESLSVSQNEPLANVSTNHKLSRDDQNLKIEIIGKRTESGMKIIDKKVVDCKANSSSSSSYRNDRHDRKNGDLHSNLQHTFNNINSGIDNNNNKQQLLNNFPSSTHLVSSVQPQILTNNTIPLNNIEPLQWPLVNPLFNGLPLQTMFGAALNVNAVGPNWIGNGLNIQATHPINPVNRILTKEEFYERQRRLRAEKYAHSGGNMKDRKRNSSRTRHRHRNESSRSPSGSQSPRRNNKSKRDEDYHKRSQRKESSSRYKVKLSNEDDNSKRYENKEKCSVRKTRSSRQREIPKSADQISYKTDCPTNTSDIKTIDPKLMQDSINTFLKYLTANSDDKIVGDSNEQVSIVSDLESRKDTIVNEVEYFHKGAKKSSRRSTRSRSVPKISKDRLIIDNSRSSKQEIVAVEIKRKYNKKGDEEEDKKSHEKSKHKSKENQEEEEQIKEEGDDCKKSLETQIVTRKPKKSKHHHRRHHHHNEQEIMEEEEEDEEVAVEDGEDGNKRKKKHRKHKLKKLKKSKKTKKDS